MLAAMRPPASTYPGSAPLNAAPAACVRQLRAQNMRNLTDCVLVLGPWFVCCLCLYYVLQYTQLCADMLVWLYCCWQQLSTMVEGWLVRVCLVCMCC
jgi:hypothetical protein